MVAILTRSADGVMKKRQTRETSALLEKGETMDERDVEIILALADNNMNESETSRALYMHRNTVIYRLRKVKRLTGLDPMNFHDLCKLVQMIQDRRLRIYEQI